MELWALSEDQEHATAAGFVLGSASPAPLLALGRSPMIEARLCSSSGQPCCSRSSSGKQLSCVRSDWTFLEDIAQHWHVCWPAAGGLAPAPPANAGAGAGAVAGAGAGTSSSTSTSISSTGAVQADSSSTNTSSSTGVGPQVFNLYLVPHTHPLLVFNSCAWVSHHLGLVWADQLLTAAALHVCACRTVYRGLVLL